MGIPIFNNMFAVTIVDLALDTAVCLNLLTGVFAAGGEGRRKRKMSVGAKGSFSKK
jgi:hypothetical protein